MKTYYLINMYLFNTHYEISEELYFDIDYCNKAITNGFGFFDKEQAEIRLQQYKKLASEIPVAN